MRKPGALLLFFFFFDGVCVFLFVRLCMYLCVCSVKVHNVVWLGAFKLCYVLESLSDPNVVMHIPPCTCSLGRA
jgi:hypothetical protein